MTDQEINQRIQTLAFPDCWVVKKRGYYYRPNAGGYTDRASEAWRIPHEEAKKHEYLHDEPVTIHPAPPLDYVNSLDAMALAEATLTGDRRADYYCRYLPTATKCDLDGWPHRELPKIVSSAARKRATAFLRVHEKEKAK